MVCEADRCRALPIADLTVAADRDQRGVAKRWNLSQFFGQTVAAHLRHAEIGQHDVGLIRASFSWPVKPS